MNTRIPLPRLAILCYVCGLLLPAGRASAAYLDNETDASNQNPNVETRRSEHFRAVFGQYNRDTGTPLTEELVQGNLQLFEQEWQRNVVENGLNPMNQSSDLAQRDGNLYRANFNFLMSFNDGGGGGAYMSSDAKGFGYFMANSSYCRVDPPSAATTHEMGHVWEGDARGFNGGVSGMWWECTANWFSLQLMNSYPFPGGAVWNQPFYFTHGRDFYDSWIIYEAFREDPRYGIPFINQVWTNANADQQANEYIINRMERLDSSGSADKPGAARDVWGDMAKKSVTWDYERKRWFVLGEVPDDGSDWWYYFGMRTPMVKQPGANGWYRPERICTPMQYGFNIIPLTASPNTTVSCNFQPACDPVRQSDWRACLVAVSNVGDVRDINKNTARYSCLWNKGANSITLSSDETKVYLVVIATPKPMTTGAWNEYRLDSGLQFPYTVSFTNATPKNVVYPAYTGTHTHHTNGGGLVQSGASVAATAYVGPNAQVLGTAQVNGYARIEDYAVVGGSAIIEGNAVVSGHAFVSDTAHVQGNAKVRDFGYLSGNAQISENARVIEHALFGDGNSASGNAVVKGRSLLYSPSVLTGSIITDGDTSNGTGGVAADHGVHFGWSWGTDASRFANLTDNNYIYEQHTFERENPVLAWDEYGINQGFLMNGCRAAKDTLAPTRGGLVLPLDGVSQYVELHNSVNDWRETAYTVWVKWTSTAADQKIWSMGDGANKQMYLTPKDGTTGNLRFVISNGTTTQYLDGASPIPANTWTHVAVVFGSPVFNTTTQTWSATGTLYVNGAQVATLADMLVPDSLNAPLMENANYLGRGNTGGYFQGCLDDFRAYMKTLTSADVLAVYNTAAPAPVTIATDTTPPTPNAATWLVPPVAIGDNAITMSATQGTDASNWVEYYFTCTAGGGHDSGWVSFNKYTDVGLTPGSSCTYTVRMRDKNGNTTADSSAAGASTPTSSAGVASFAYGPMGTGGGSVTMTATKVASPGGLVEYKFDRITPSAATSGWRSSPTWTDTGLASGSACSYTVTVRYGSGSVSAASAPASATVQDQSAPKLTVQVAQWNMLPYATIDNRVSMRAVGVQESGCSFYYQCVSGGGPDSGWIAAPDLDTWDNSYAAGFIPPTALADGTYGYRYKMKDAAGNESAWSTTQYAKITPTTGYHACTFAETATLPDDCLVTFNGVVVGVNTNNYVVRGTSGIASITVKPNHIRTDGGSDQQTFPEHLFKNVTVKGHLYTIGGVRQVTYATVLTTGSAQTANVTGRVTRQSDGAPVADATVSFSLSSDAAAHATVTATADANGNYAAAIINGTWYVAAAADACNTSADQIIAVNGANVPNVNFSLIDNSTISGRVSNSAGGAALAGATVYFSTLPNAGNVVFTATTDNSGNYSLPVQNGTWYVGASALGFSLSFDITVVVSGSNVTGGNHTLTAASLLAWYKFDETTGLTAADSSGNGKNGTLVGDGCTWGTGNLNNAVSLDGSGPTSSYISCPANLMTSISNFTISTWVNFGAASAFNSNRRIFDFNAGMGAASMYLSQWGQNGGSGQSLHYAIKPSGASAETSFDYAGPVPLGAWQHIAISQSGDVVTLYVDGLPVAQQAGMPKPLSVGSTPNDWIGRSQWSNPGAGDPCLSGLLDNFKIYSSALGAETIRALANEGAKQFSYTITASAGTGGTIDPSGAVVVNPGTNRTFTITPNVGYAISQVTMDGVDQGAISSYTFNSVAANHTISATFVAAAYHTITASAGINGTISPSGYVIVNQGASQTFTITPNDGYKVSSVSVDGANVGAVTSYTFTSVTYDHIITASFVIAVQHGTLVHEWGFDGNGNDSAGGNTAVVNGAAAFATTGGLFGGGCLTGCASQADYAAPAHFPPPGTTANGTTGTRSYTVSAWVNLNGSNPSSEAEVFAWGQNNGNGQSEQVLATAASRVLKYGRWDGATWQSSFVGSIPNSEWHLLAVTVSGNLVNQYLDNTQVGVNATITNTPSTGEVTIGGLSFASYAFGANKKIDDVAVWSSPLSAGKVAALYNVLGVNGGALNDYNAGKVDVLFQVFDNGTPQNVTSTAGTLAWSKFTGVSGTAGQVLYDGNDYTVWFTATDGVKSNWPPPATLTITASTGSGGAISPSGDVLVANGGGQTFSITPNPGYVIATVLLDGVNNSGAVSSGTYTFTNVSANHAISATFTALTTPSVTLTRHSGTTSSSIYGDSLSFDVSVTGSPTPTGSVTLKDGGSNGITVGSGTLTGGACTIITTALTAGIHPSIVAVYAGDSHYASAISSDLDTQTVSKATPVVTVTGTTSFTYNGSPQGPNTITMSPVSTGAVTYSYVGSGGTSYGPNSTQPVNAGSYTVTATVAADANFTSASSVATAFTIAKAPPVVTVTVGSYTYNGSPQGPDTATTGGSTGVVAFSYAGSGGTSYPASATKPTDAGSYAVTATVAADSNFNSASSSPTAFTIAKATPSLSVTNSPVIYNGSAQAAAVSGSVAGTVSSVKYNGLATVPSAVATYAVTADFVPTDSANYNVLTGASAGNFVISPPPTTTAGTATASAAGQSGITVTMPYTDDGNANNTYTVEYKFSSGSTWVAWVSNAAHVVSPYTTTITGLTPATSYDIRVTYNDADGLTGTNPQTITGVTTSNPTVATLDAWTNVSSTAPGNASGTVNVTGQTVSGGSNRLLVVAVCMEANGTPVTMTASATFGGKALTAIGSSLTTGREFCYMGYLKDVDIPSAASTLAVTYGCTGTSRTISGLHIKWASYTNVDQATPIHDSNANYNGAANVTFGAQIDYLNRGLVFFAAANGGTPTTITAPTDFSAVSAAAASTNAHTSYVGTTASRTSSGNYASTVSVAFNGTTSTRSALVVASLRPARATPAVWVTNSATYNGSAQAATVTGSVAGTVSNVKYNGSATVPTATGTFAVTADFTPGDSTTYSSLTGAPAGSFVIQKAGASVTLGNLAQIYDGTPKPAMAATIPPGLTVDLTYNGSATPPTAIGSYAVEATVNEPNYTGTATGTLVISEAAVVTWRKVHFTTEEIAAGLVADDADPDGDGATNLAEFAFNGNPRNGASTGMFFTRLADGSLTYTCAVRRGAVFVPNAVQARVSLAIDGLVYTIEGTATLSGGWDGVITDQGTSDTAPAGSGLSDLTGSGWQYHTFSAFNGLAGKGFLRARVETSP